jgi:hypothetical protein
MATGLIALLDDIATLLDDIAVLSKRAASKTAGVVTDDLAVGAEQVSNFASARELPVVWKVAKGSFINKAILVPLALVLSFFAPWAIPVLLIAGGVYLCFEGAEKLMDMLGFGHHDDDHDGVDDIDEIKNLSLESEAYKNLENIKVKGAVKTDFVLSAEIIVIALGTMTAATFTNKVLALSAIAIIMTVGVYALVALLVKLDDIGFWLKKKDFAVAQVIGSKMVSALPFLMKVLSWGGTLAMFLVGGGIFVEHIPMLEVVHHSVEALPSVAKLIVVTVVGMIGGVIAIYGHKLWEGALAKFSKQ